MDIFWELYTDLPRGGPGNNESTRKAFLMLNNLPTKPIILDIGCGPGMQTIELAKLSNGKIIAIDIHQPFLDRLNQKAIEEGVSEKIKTINKSMMDLDFEKNTFDVIWAEGAIFIIGFENGLKAWRVFLKKKGYLVVSELAWLKENPPDQIKNYLEVEYPPIKTYEENIKIIKGLGYKFINSFILQETCWLEYYDPLEKKIIALRKKYKGNLEVNKHLDNAQKEIDLYKKYSEYYGYIFHLMQNV